MRRRAPNRPWCSLRRPLHLPRTASLRTAPPPVKGPLRRSRPLTASPRLTCAANVNDTPDRTITRPSYVTNSSQGGRPWHCSVNAEWGYAYGWPPRSLNYSEKLHIRQ